MTERPLMFLPPWRPPVGDDGEQYSGAGVKSPREVYLPSSRLTASIECPTFMTASPRRSLETLNLSAQHWTSKGSLRSMRDLSAGPRLLKSSAIRVLLRHWSVPAHPTVDRENEGLTIV